MILANKKVPVKSRNEQVNKKVPAKNKNRQVNKNKQKNIQSTIKKEDKNKKTKMIIGIAASVVVLAIIGIVWGVMANKPANNPASNPANGSTIAVISIKNYGEIEVELNATAAPISVENFVSLAESGFYDGLTFHRIISGFMIQGGDPEGTGMGGSDKQIKGEFSANGVNNPISHTRGVIAMARSQANDSASSQFFIVHQDSPHLDGNYAGFGMVTKGMEIVDAICKDIQPQDGNGTVLAADQPVIESIKIVQ